MGSTRVYLVIFGLAVVVASGFAVAIDQPGYTDAYYYYNAGYRLADGEGLTDPYLWIYINAPDKLPGPSHTYWMPLTSLVAAVGLVVGGHSFGAAQVPFVLCLAGLVTVAAWTGAHVGQKPRYLWGASLLVLFSGFFTPFWTTTDSFALYALVGALALITIGKGRETGDWRWYAWAGGLSALGHLTRADGLLLLLVLIIVALWPREKSPWSRRAGLAMVGLIAYGLVMLPWFVRNWSEIGTLLPTGGMQAIWLRGYDEIVNYPPGVTAADFWEWGLGNILRSRLDVLLINLQTFVAVETWMILGPFVLLGLWNRRREPFLLGVILYAVGLHLAMTFVFAYPGSRGGLFHSSAALLPFWAVLGLLGLDDGIVWMSKRRPWNPGEAKLVFGTALILFAIGFSVATLLARLETWNARGDFYRDLDRDLPAGASVMLNDPASFYYHTGRSGVAVPNADPSVVPEIAARYGIDYLLLDKDRTKPFTGLFFGEDTRPFLKLQNVYDAGTADPADDKHLFEIVPVEN